MFSLEPDSSGVGVVLMPALGVDDELVKAADRAALRLKVFGEAVVKHEVIVFYGVLMTGGHYLVAASH